MDNRMVQVPVTLLLDTDQTPSAKVLWMALRLHPAAGLAELMRHTGLAKQTVRSGLARAKAALRTQGGPRVKVPAALLASRTVGARAKVLYGLLQATPDFRGHGGRFTYTALSAWTKLSPNTLKLAIGELVGADWVRTTQASRLSPLHFKLGSPELIRGQAAAAAARRRLNRARHTGEAIMQEYLSLLIASDQFTDNARPGFLVNPLTGERLELDRFYPPGLAFEYHGDQHDRATAKFSQAQVDAQYLRDLIKAGICAYREIHLVIIRAEDLSLQGMIKKVRPIMSLRNLAGQEPLIDLLEDASLTYRAETDAARNRERPR